MNTVQKLKLLTGMSNIEMAGRLGMTDRNIRRYMAGKDVSLGTSEACKMTWLRIKDSAVAESVDKDFKNVRGR